MTLSQPHSKSHKRRCPPRFKSSSPIVAHTCRGVLYNALWQSFQSVKKFKHKKCVPSKVLHTHRVAHTRDGVDSTMLHKQECTLLWHDIPWLVQPNRLSSFFTFPFTLVFFSWLLAAQLGRRILRSRAVHLMLRVHGKPFEVATANACDGRAFALPELHSHTPLVYLKH